VSRDIGGIIRRKYSAEALFARTLPLAWERITVIQRPGAGGATRIVDRGPISPGSESRLQADLGSSAVVPAELRRDMANLHLVNQQTEARVASAGPGNNWPLATRLLVHWADPTVTVLRVDDQRPNRVIGRRQTRPVSSETSQVPQLERPVVAAGRHGATVGREGEKTLAVRKQLTSSGNHQARCHVRAPAANSLLVHPGCADSATIRNFSSRLQRRRSRCNLDRIVPSPTQSRTATM
jgi:hypothetical protein